MGKQTLYHPIPLSVLRGSLEYCGWKFAALKQSGKLIDKRSVVYKISGIKPPPDAPLMDVFMLQHNLQKCFEKRIVVSRVVTDTTGKIEAWIIVRSPRPLEDAVPEAEKATTGDLPF